jgi:polysaccharide deacetylase 2 family uncharacterized protein YibQ
MERTLFGARKTDAPFEPFQPAVEEAVVNRPAGWAPETPPSPSEAVRLAIVICGMGTDGTLDRHFEDIPYALSFAVPATGDVPADVLRSESHSLLIESTASSLDGITKRLEELHAGGVITPLAGHPADVDGFTGRFTGSTAFIIDGMAGGEPLYYDAAHDQRIPSASRDIVIDAYEEQAYIAYMLRQAVQLARRTGVAIAVGHAYPETYEALRRNLPQLVAANDVHIVPVGDLVR